MKIIILFFYLLLVFSFKTYCQGKYIYFDSIYDCNNNKYACAFTTYETTYGYFTVGISSLPGRVICVLKTDKQGNRLEVKNYGKTGCNVWPGAQGSLTKTTDGGYALGGGVTSSYNAKALLVKFNNNGDTLWTREFGDNIAGSFHTARQCKHTKDKGYIIVGEKEMGLYNIDVLLIKTDSLGNLLWQKTYGGPNIDIGWTIAVTPDSGFIIGGYKYTYGVNYSKNALVIKTDSLGNIQWQKEFGGAYDDSKAVVSVARDGNLFVMLTYAYSQLHPSEPSFKKFNLIKLSIYGEVIWDKKYGPIEYANNFDGFYELSNSNIITTGCHFPPTGAKPAAIFMLSSTGDSLWWRDYKRVLYNGTNSLFNIQQTSDNGLVACGEVASAENPNNGQYMWLLKLDSMGCLEPNCDGVIIVEPYQKNNENILKVFPNPAQNYFTIEYKISKTEGNAIIEMLDLTGKKLRILPIYDKQNQIVVETKDIQTGIYYIRLLIDGAAINTQKISIIK
jgi:hypothetical protein